MTNKANENTGIGIKNKQTKTLILIIFGIVVCLLLAIGGSSKANKKPSSNVKSQDNNTIEKKINLNKSLKTQDDMTDWHSRIWDKFAKTEQHLTNLDTQMQQMLVKNGDQNDKTNIEQLSAQVQELKETIEKLTATQPPVIENIREDNISLINAKSDLEPLKEVSNTPIKSKENYVPAGAFVKAIMLGGADASAGALGKSNPTPVLLRILEDGTLPNNKHSSLKGCLVTAATAGDISSERGLMRIERMSCVKPNGKVLDVEVEGTVFGSEGKNGVRGTPLWREGSLLWRAAAAGTLSGFSQGLSQKYTTSSISPLGSTQTVNNGDVAKYGLAQGFGNAMDKLADYNIQRAEQYHPVIQLSAGTEVDIVFLKGFYLDEEKPANLTNKETTDDEVTVENVNDSNTESPKPLTLTTKQAEKIKEYGAGME